MLRAEPQKTRGHLLLILVPYEKKHGRVCIFKTDRCSHLYQLQGAVEGISSLPIPSFPQRVQRNMQCVKELRMPVPDLSRSRTLENAMLFNTDGVDGAQGSPTRVPLHSRLLKAT